jgi:hypothetical protein
LIALLLLLLLCVLVVVDVVVLLMVVTSAITEWLGCTSLSTKNNKIGFNFFPP